MLTRPLPNDSEQQATGLQALYVQVLQSLELIPRHWLKPFKQPEAYVRIAFLTEEIIAHRIQHNQATEIARTLWTQSDEDVSLFPPALAPIAGSSKSVSILLPQSDCLHRTIDMPAGRPSTLRAALTFELERISPTDPQSLYFDFTRIARDTKAKKVSLDLRIVKRETVDRAITWCRNAGLRVGAIEFDGEMRPADWRIFPVDRWALLHLFLLRNSIALLACGVILLLVLVLGSAYGRGAERLETIHNDRSVMETQAALVSRIRAQMRQTKVQAEFLQTKKDAPPVVGIVAILTQTLPDNTWLTDLHIDGDHIRMQGYSKAASDLMGILERSGSFTNAQFAAPLIKTNDTDRFDLSFELRRRTP